MSYDVSLSALDASYKTLQKSLHPDRFHGEQQKEQHDIASALSAKVNHAFTTLKQPYERALYLLSLHGLELSESTGTVTDPELLMGIMEIREELEETSATADLHRFALANRASLSTLYLQMSSSYATGDMATMRHLTVKLSYLQNIETEIYKKMPVS